MRLAFGTFLGAPDPRCRVRRRRDGPPALRSRAELGLCGGDRWRAGWLELRDTVGQLRVHRAGDRAARSLGPWYRGPVDAAGRGSPGWVAVRQSALFTFPHSPKHIGLYQKFGFWPQYLTPVLEQAVAPNGGRGYSTYSSLPDAERPDVLGACQRVTGAIFRGSRRGAQKRSVRFGAQALGDTVLIHDDSQLVGFAVCPLGRRRGGKRRLLPQVRRGAPRARRGERFRAAARRVRGARGRTRPCANSGGRQCRPPDAYRRLLGRGYRVSFEGVIMQRPNEHGYCRPDVYAIDDLR